MEQTKKKKLYVKVPSHIVRNEEKFLSNDEFLMYARLCFLYFRNFKESKKEIEVDHKKLKHFLKINDTRTLKNRLKRFYKLGLIENEIKTLPIKGTLTIIFNEKVYEEDKHFTLISADLFNYYTNGQIDEYAFRQIFYYKSHINLDDKEKDRKYCFVGFETLSKRLKVSNSKIIEANEQLTKAKLIKIKKHVLEENGEYNELDELVFTRYNNHYFVHSSMH
jgi:hypothetical protein